MAQILTQNQYQNQFVDFYKQTLGTGISTSVAKPGDPDDDGTDDTGARQGPTVQGGGDDTFNPMGGISLTNPAGTTYNYSKINANDYIKNNQKSAKQSGDLSMSGFFDYAKTQLKDPNFVVPAIAGAMTGLPIGPMGIAAAEMNRKQQYENAKKIAAAGGSVGNMMDFNGQTLSRAPGSKQYVGTLGGYTSEQIYALEELQKGYIPGTMTESFGSDEMGNPEGYTTGKAGLLDAATAERLGGNYDAYGNWHSTKFGTVSGSAPMSAAKALAAQNGVNTAGWSSRDFVNFSNNWKSSAKSTTSTGSFFKDLFSNPLKDSTIDQYKTQVDKVVSNIKGYTPGGDSGGDSSPPPPPPGGTTASQDPSESGSTGTGYTGGYDEGPVTFSSGDDDGGNSGGGSSFSGGTGGTADFGGALSGARGFADGGRIGMQAGGMAAQPAGFVQGPPGQFSNRETVADDQPMEVAEGTFVINAPAVEHAGTQDIRKMILDAYTIAREKGLDIGNVDRKIYESTVDVALSKGEVIVPPQLAKIIGYDRLEKINNRGKKEVSRRQQASEGGFLGLAEGGSVYDYEDPIILDEVKRKMEEIISSAEQQGVAVSSFYEDPVPFLNEEEALQAKKATEKAVETEGFDPKVFGPFFGDSDFLGMGEAVANVPRTPSLFNLFVTAEELAHALGSKKNISTLAKQPGMTDEEIRYNEEVRAKQIAYETVRGLLPQGKKTAQFSLDHYGYQFLKHIQETTPQEIQNQVISSMAEKYPELQSLLKNQERIARSQRVEQTLNTPKASGGFISK